MKTNNIKAVEMMRALRDKQNEKINSNPEKFYSDLEKYNSNFMNITKDLVGKQNITLT